MAERGPAPVDSTKGLDCHLVECPICLEQVRRPTWLPCLHSFCQECLSIYVVNESSGNLASPPSFPCPVCRKEARPVNPSEGKEKWAQQFPSNNLEGMQPAGTKKIKEPKKCKPCKKKDNLDIPAKFWCKTTNTLFCESCKIEHHDLVHEECELIDVTEDEVEQQPFSTFGCGKHQEKMEYYCEDHNMIGCCKCIIQDHRKCETVTSAEDFCDRLRNTSQLENILESLQQDKDGMVTVLERVNKQQHSMTHDKDIGLKSLSYVRQEIDQSFDSIQNGLANELVAVYKREKERLQVFQHKFERLLFAVQNTLESAVLTTDTIERICVYQRGQAEAEACKTLVAEFQESFTPVRLKHEFDSFSRDQNAGLVMGKIVVQKEGTAQKATPAVKLVDTILSKRRAKQIGKFRIRTTDKTCSCGVIFLPCGQTLVGDYRSKHLRLFTETGNCLHESPVQGHPLDMCLNVDDGTIMVICQNNPSSQTEMNRFLIQVRICESKIQIEQAYLTSGEEIQYGVAIADGTCVFGTGTGVTSQSCPVRDAYFVYVYPHPEQKPPPPFTKLLQRNSKCLHLTSDPRTGHVFASFWTSTPGDVAVTRLQAGAHADILNVGVVKDAAGIDVDAQGNVYVCGAASNNVIQMSEDGANVRELLTSSDGVERPRAISVCGDKFVVTNQSPTQQDYVHVYQLVCY